MYQDVVVFYHERREKHVKVAPRQVVRSGGTVRIKHDMLPFICVVTDADLVMKDRTLWRVAMPSAKQVVAVAHAVELEIGQVSTLA